MNKQQLYTAGSVLLATTALSGAANAGTLQGAFASGFRPTTTALTQANVANTVFSTTATTANAVTVGPFNVFMAFSNNFTAATKFSIELTPINAGFIQAVDARIALGDATGSFVSGAIWTSAATTACTSITPLTTKIILDGCGGLSNKISATNGANTNTSASYAGVIFSGVSFNNAAGLASVGGTIGLSGIVYNANNASQQFETIAATNVITSIAPIVASVVAAGTATASASSTPVAFSYFSTSTAVPTGVLTVILAVVDISSTGALAADLTTAVLPEAAAGAAAQGISSIQVTVTSGALTQAAVQSVSVNGVNGGAGIQNATISNFSAGVATFSINSNSGFTSFSISVAFSGTTALSAAAAGTVSVSFGVGGSVPTGQAVPAISGKTSSISLGGFNAELNTFLGSSNTSFSSFARIHNNGIIASTATVTVRNDATGVTMGTYTTASIATGQTLQISAKDIETGAGITAAAGLNYTLSISGAFSGYAQHIIFNPATGQLADLSSFRNRAAAGGVTAP
jgi:hypothetical protein